MIAATVWGLDYERESLVIGENANFDLGTLCASYVLVAKKFHSLRDFRGSRSIHCVSIR
jgi:hypothetical protein